MTRPPVDYFATLSQPRRPWLAAEELKETFHRATALHHPDKNGSEQESAELNAAFATLREPAPRLRHLLELEHPEALGQKTDIAAALGDTFLRLATLRRAVEAFVEQQSGAASPLAQALLAPERFALQHDVQKELDLLGSKQTAALAKVEALDQAWPDRTSEIVTAAAALQQELTYLAKWHTQLREMLFRVNS
jgi:curved DNA-binding protein CbpA